MALIRIRRIKCDEEKPSCRRCTSTGRKCDWYDEDDTPSKDIAHESTLAPSEFASLSLLPLQVTPSLTLTEEESIGFDFFRRKTAVEIQGCFRTTLWESLVLQITQQEPSVLDAAIAVGCAHRKYAERRMLYPTTDVYDQRQFFGLKQYLKAISSLRARINNLEDPNSSRVALVTCLLFICHEMFRGQRVGAINHLATGLRILASRTISHSSTESSTLTLRNDSENVQDQLVSIFARLDYDSTMFGQRSPRFSLNPHQRTTAGDLSVPSNFSSLEEAREHLDILANGVLRFGGKLLELSALVLANRSPDFMTQVLWEHAAARTVDLSDHPSLLVEMRRLGDGLAIWSAAFKAYQTGLPTAQRSNNSATLALLEIQQFYPYIILSTCQTTKEKYLDSFNATFSRVVSLAENYIESTNSSPTLFTLDSGVLPSLYITAVKCRQRETRRRAISLLRESKCQEGMWEGKLIAGFVERIADLEDARAYELSGLEAGEIAEEARFCDVALAVTDDPRRGKLICARYCHETGGELMVWDEYFTLQAGDVLQ
jgi:Fungal specific transcription factor domain/Fungal Zn(2)-Cys(6) binuclear cluster domain